jgi:hypothetical protein
MLAQTRPGARGALLFYSCVPVTEFGSAWPDQVPVQVHGMDADPIFVGQFLPRGQAGVLDHRAAGGEPPGVAGLGQDRRRAHR